MNLVYMVYSYADDFDKEDIFYGFFSEEVEAIEFVDIMNKSKPDTYDYKELKQLT